MEGIARLLELASKLGRLSSDMATDKTEKTVEEIGGDDAADALRYLIATKPREVRQRKLVGCNASHECFTRVCFDVVG